jgi:hypothetical protein
MELFIFKTNRQKIAILTCQIEKQKEKIIQMAIAKKGDIQFEIRKFKKMILKLEELKKERDRKIFEECREGEIIISNGN